MPNSITFLKIFLIMAALFGVITLATTVILGYSGYAQFSGRSNLIFLDLQCTNKYYVQKYRSAIQASLKLGYISTLISSFLAIVCLGVLVFFMCKSKKIHKRRRSHQNQNQYQDTQRISIYEGYSLQSNESKLMFVIVSISVISSFIPFKQFLEYMIQTDSNICSATINQAQLFGLIILYGLVLLFCLLALIVTISLNCTPQQNVSILGTNTHSSKEHQILSDSPESQRKMYELDRKEEIQPFEEQEHEQKRIDNDIMIRQMTPSQEQESINQERVSFQSYISQIEAIKSHSLTLRISDLKQIESVIQDTNLELQIESIFQKQ